MGPTQPNPVQPSHQTHAAKHWGVSGVDGPHRDGGAKQDPESLDGRIGAVYSMTDQGTHLATFGFSSATGRSPQAAGRMVWPLLLALYSVQCSAAVNVTYLRFTSVYCLPSSKYS